MVRYPEDFVLRSKECSPEIAQKWIPDMRRSEMELDSALQNFLEAHNKQKNIKYK